uniref:Uncharacterized protein n=1 Tax=virus sp. ctmTa7 TaxID=2828255 RepID=A0A8S5RBU6_9VIRU|nr:MAG TPA: hypothetical protein [virus sp. ctmTa7]
MYSLFYLYFCIRKSPISCDTYRACLMFILYCDIIVPYNYLNYVKNYILKLLEFKYSFL